MRMPSAHEADAKRASGQEIARDCLPRLAGDLCSRPANSRRKSVIAWAITGRVGLVSLPADRGGDLPQDRLKQARVVVDAELVRDSEQERVCSEHRLIARELVGD